MIRSIVFVVSAAVVWLGLITPSSSGETLEHWVGSWSAAPQMQLSPPSVSQQTVREYVHLSLGGDSIRVRLSNEFGSAALNVGSAHVALVKSLPGQKDLVSGSDRTLTFHGNPGLTILPGQEVISDPVPLSVPAQADLAVSLYISNSIAVSTFHAVSMVNNFISGAGNFAASEVFPNSTYTMRSFFLSGIDVSTKNERDCSIVAFGDSITDGNGSQFDSNTRWPDFLAARLLVRSKKAAFSLGVLNEGIAANRVLEDITSGEQPSLSGLKRFDQDVLQRPQVCFLVILEGINDIGNSPVTKSSDELLESLKSAYTQMIQQAHARGIKVVGATLTPVLNSGYYSDRNEKTRQSLNQWIRQGSVYDAVVDFDLAVRDPKNPAQILPQYDCGDHLHPSSAGYEAMAHAFDLSIFKR